MKTTRVIVEKYDENWKQCFLDIKLEILNTLGDLGIPGRESFAYEGKEYLMKHHLYVCPEDSAELKRHVAFRDYVRRHPEAVKEYSRIKEEGARLYPDDIEKYIKYKTPFIEKIYNQLEGENYGT